MHAVDNAVDHTNTNATNFIQKLDQELRDAHALIEVPEHGGRTSFGRPFDPNPHRRCERLGRIRGRLFPSIVLAAMQTPLNRATVADHGPQLARS